MDEVYVVEVVSTGTSGVPRDTVTEVGVCRMLADGSDFDTVFHGRLCIEPLDIGKSALDHLESEYGITAETLYSGDAPEEVTEGFRRTVFGKECTSFDVGATFGKYLSFEPWDSARELTVLPSYSLRLPKEMRHGSVPSCILSTYSEICPGDPAGTCGRRDALSLSMMSASILMRLRCDGLFRSPLRHPRHDATDRNARARIHPSTVRGWYAVA